MNLIAVYGGSFNPPGKHHQRIAEFLSGHFSRIIIVPCGQRPDKIAVGETRPEHRAEMCRLAFKGMTGVKIDTFDLEAGSFTRTWRLQERFQAEYGKGSEIWHVVGGDLIQGGGKGESEIQRTWERGKEIWQCLNFAVLMRPGHEFVAEDVPPHHRLFSPGVQGSSTEIRARIYAHQPVAGLVIPEVADYIQKYGLYSKRL